MPAARRLPRTMSAFAVLCLMASTLPAQTNKAQSNTSQPNTAGGPIVVNDLGRATVPLGGLWKFHLGDDPAWASSTFDDSSWEQIDIGRPWGDQGHYNYAGRAWYRRQIDLTSAPADLSLYVPDTSCSYEIYWNGQLIGSTDAMPAPTMLNQSIAETFPFGAQTRGVLAFRAQTTPLDSTSPGNSVGLAAIPQIGSTEAIANLAASSRTAALRSRLLDIVQIILYGQLFLLALLLWLRNRNQKLLFWITAFLLAAGLWVAVDPFFFPWLLASSTAGAFYGPTFHSLEDVTLWYLLLYLLNLDRYPALVRWTRILAWIALCSAMGDGLVFSIPNRDAHFLLFEVLDAIATVGFSIPAIFPFILIALAFRKGLDPARRFVAVAAFLSDVYFVIHHTAVQGQRFTHIAFGDPMMQPMFTISGVAVSMPAILSLVLVGAIVYAVYRYLVEQGQRQTILEQEYRNARAVQQVLIPDELPITPGFTVHSVYKPFGEVGGDFFQIIPLPTGGLLAIIGDVSGKGMPAAMTVSLLVGTSRTLAHYTQSPGQMLAAMNHRMIGRSHGGFTTCLILRLDLDGTLTAANAGHIAPYLAGHELALENGLPLGLDPSATYAESAFYLSPDRQLTLMTDGVVEARDPSGALFGFERTVALTLQPAEAVAAAAQHFGQDDDITVLTLTRLQG